MHETEILLDEPDELPATNVYSGTGRQFGHLRCLVVLKINGAIKWVNK